jgi:hypothetical protein
VEKCDFAKDTQSGNKSAPARIAREFLDVLAARHWAVVVGVVGVVGVCRVEGTGWNRHQIQRRAEDRISNGDSYFIPLRCLGGNCPRCAEPEPVSSMCQ